MVMFLDWHGEHYLQPKVLAHSSCHPLAKICSVPHDMPWQ